MKGATISSSFSSSSLHLSSTHLPIHPFHPPQHSSTQPSCRSTSIRPPSYSMIHLSVHPLSSTQPFSHPLIQVFVPLTSVHLSSHTLSHLSNEHLMSVQASVRADSPCNVDMCAKHITEKSRSLGSFSEPPRAKCGRTKANLTGSRSS